MRIVTTNVFIKINMIEHKIQIMAPFSRSAAFKTLVKIVNLIGTRS